MSRRHPLQSLIDTMNDLDQKTRSKYHLTLGGLILALEHARENALFFTVPDEYGLVRAASYRGYYCDLSLVPGAVGTVSEALTILRAALDGTFTGYKGGDYVMGEDTPLWVAEWGCTGLAVTGLRYENDDVVLVTKNVDD